MLLHSSLLLSFTAGCSIYTSKTTDDVYVADPERNTNPNETVEGESLVEDEDTGSYEELDPDACPEGGVYQNQYGRWSLQRVMG